MICTMCDDWQWTMEWILLIVFVVVPLILAGLFAWDDIKWNDDASLMATKQRLRKRQRRARMWRRYRKGRRP